MLDLQVQTGFWTTLSNGDENTKWEERRSGRDLCMAEDSDESTSVHFQIQMFCQVVPAVPALALLRLCWLLSGISPWACSLRPCTASLRTQINWWFHFSWKWVEKKGVMLDHIMAEKKICSRRSTLRIFQKSLFFFPKSPFSDSWRSHPDLVRKRLFSR